METSVFLDKIAINLYGWLMKEQDADDTLSTIFDLNRRAYAADAFARLRFALGNHFHDAVEREERSFLPECHFQLDYA
jgi:hypothetical protein